jgi:hypothetical protein
MPILMLLALAAAGQSASPAPAPDYTQDAAWLCRPGRQDACSANQDVTVVRADGSQTVQRFKPAANPKFDCFYVYPTVSLDKSPNSDMEIGPEETQVATAQAGRFAANCRVFAPMYRQVTLTALRAAMTGQPMAADRAMALGDVTAAFDEYMKRDNHGRGVVLIGHSQGSGVLKAMLQQRIDGKPEAMKPIISAMLIGTNVAVPEGKDVGGDFKTMKLCRTADQSGCIVTYMTFRADSPPPANSRFGTVPEAGMVAACTNPASLGGGKAVTQAIFSTAGAGTASLPAGPWASTGKPVTTPFVAVPGLISAECTATNGFHYLAASVNADPKDPRTDTIVGDVVANGVTLKDWGLHLIDMPVEMGDLVDLTARQAAAWQARR